MRAAAGNLPRLGWLMLFLGLLVAMGRRHGDAPRLWLDTLNDDHLVRACLEHEDCRTRGATVSFGTLVQGGSWHELRAAAGALGLSRTGLHRLLLLLDALSLLLIAFAAFRLAGAGVAVLAVAAWLALDNVVESPGVLLWNYRPILWLAAIMTGLGLSLARGAGPGTAALAGALSAILAGCHLVGLTLAGPLLLVVLLLGPRRLAGAAAFGAAFLAVTLAGSLDAWSANLRAFSTLAPRPAGGQETALAAFCFLLALLPACAAWIGPRERRRDLASLALLAGFPLLASLLVRYLFSLPTPPIYLTPAFPALSIGSAAGLVFLARRLFERLRRAPPPPAAHGTDVRAPAAALALCGIGVALLSVPEYKTIASVPYPSFANVEAAANVLRSEGWSKEQLFAHLKGPMAPLFIEAVCHDFPSGPADGRRAYWLPLLSRPDPFPPQWKEFGGHVLAPAYGFLDWTHLRACTGCQESECREAPLVPAPYEFERLSTTISGMPDIPSGERRPFCLRIPLDPRAAAAPGIYLAALPDIDGICRGQIVAAPSGGLVLDGGHRALLVTPNVGGELWIRYEPGGARCPIESLAAFPPFFLEGTEAEVAIMLAALSPPPKIGREK